jgi:hypothetical protein
VASESVVFLTTNLLDDYTLLTAMTTCYDDTLLTSYRHPRAHTRAGGAARSCGLARIEPRRPRSRTAARPVGKGRGAPV